MAWPELRAYERVALRLTAGLGLTAVMLSLAALTGWFAYAPLAVGALAAIGGFLAGSDAWRKRQPPASSAAVAPWIRAPYYNKRT